MTADMQSFRNSIRTEMDGLKTSLDSRVSKTESAIRDLNEVRKLKQGDGLSVASGSTKAGTDRHDLAWKPRYVQFKGWVSRRDGRTEP
eukprot:7700631-Pyramimonas_sp.AAC.1